MGEMSAPASCRPDDGRPVPTAGMMRGGDGVRRGLICSGSHCEDRSLVQGE